VLYLKKIAVLLSIAVVSGCAVQKVKLDEESAQKYSLKYSGVIVEDFTQDKKVSTSDVVWVNGWIPLSQWFDVQSPNKSYYKYLKSSFVPAGGGDSLRVALIDAGFFMEKDFADDVAFVNLLAMQRERGYKCTASISISDSRRAERKDFEVQERASGFVDAPWLQEFSSRCRIKLTDQINSYLQDF